jgi:hypothetical protein
MVLVLHARAPLKKKGLLLSSRITVEQVAAALLAGMKGTPLEALATSDKLRQPDHFAVTLHPAGGIVALRVMEDHVEVLVKTSDLGPGYHAYLVSLLESAAARLGVTWEWDDKTGYVQDRNFARLQTRMTEFLKDLARAPDEHGGSDAELAGCRINLGFDLEEIETDENEVLTPLGPKTVDEVRHWQSLDAAELARAAADFFPWWGQGFDGGFYRGLTLYSLWNDVRWAYPIDPKEVELAKRTLRWCKEAVDRGVVDPVLQPPVLNEVGDVILAKQDPVHFPDGKGVGYRRRMMKKRLGHGWALTIPASLGERGEPDDAQTLVLLNHVLEIRISMGIAASRRPLQPGEIDKRDSQVEFRGDVTIVNLAARALQTSDTDALCLLTATLQDDRYRDLTVQIVESLEYDAEEAD